MSTQLNTCVSRHNEATVIVLRDPFVKEMHSIGDTTGGCEFRKRLANSRGALTDKIQVCSYSAPAQSYNSFNALRGTLYRIDYTERNHD